MNEEIIWGFFYSKFKNPYGVAALMGNLYVESKLNPRNLQGSYEKKFNMTDEEYTKAVDDGTYQSFVRDGAGYGLVQWTFWSRKEALLNYAKECNSSIGDLSMQLNFIMKEIQSYKTCYKAILNATSVRECSDIICERYEKPADQSEKGKQNRAEHGQRYFNMFTKPEKKRVIVTTDKVNIRSGNDKSYIRLAQVNKGTSYDWVATAENGWNAVKLTNQVGWISGEFSKVQ